MDSVVFDSSAILAYMLGERGGAAVKSALRTCRRRRRQGLLSAASLAEIHRRVRRNLDRAETRRMLDALLLIPIRLVPLDRGLAGDAADLSRETGAGLMDAIVATTALASNAVVLTADPDFAALKSVVRMEFVR